jgi:dipeptidyl aminopeptidase/acylaminoacyl peptidase
MKKILLFLIPNFLIINAIAQSLTVEKIMQDQSKWIGTAPSNPFWSEDSKTIYFSWNPEKNMGDSLYKISLSDKKPIKVSPAERRLLPSISGDYNKNFSLKVYEKQGELFIIDTKTLITRQLTSTIDNETNPVFNVDETKVIFSKSGNLFSINISDGLITQLSNFQPGLKKEKEAALNDQEKWLKTDQLANFEVLKERKDKKDAAELIAKADLPKRPKEIYYGEKALEIVKASPDLQYITYRLSTKPKSTKTTQVPNYVTESGFTENLPSRTKVGASQNSYESFVYDIKKDTTYPIFTKNIPGLKDTLDFRKEYPKKTVAKKDTLLRKTTISSPIWSENSTQAIVIVSSDDNKDRWIMQLDPIKGKLKNLDRQHDEAWIGGPGIGGGFGNGNVGWLDDQTIYFQSEADGYSHLYTLNIVTNEKKQLTKGKYEVQNLTLARDKQSFYLTTNQVHPGEQHFYKISKNGGESIKLTAMEGGNICTLSPDETHFINRYSSSNKPWELFLQENKPNSTPQQLTSSLTEEFKAYSWKKPKIISFTASDSKEVFARIYEPTKKLKNKKAVIFVHGAGYLQNAHKWWSQYSREYMFHNLLVDKGYTVLDIDYRASAGYGRDTRTGIYRFMGGKDLTDNVEGAELLVKKYGIDPKKIGIYGGSYGGFITLMALFTTPDVFAAGAALRPVTDWAAYNQGYTSNILNEPQTDSLAYRKSSPIYHAKGLKGHLLICHGIVDVNVHIQDSYRLVQRLIELKKDNWEMASYPVEDHGFVEPTSWMDEYKRILKLFEKNL